MFKKLFEKTQKGSLVRRSSCACSTPDTRRRRLPPTLLRSARPTAQAGRALLDVASRRVGGGVRWSDVGSAGGYARRLAHLRCVA